MGNSRPRTPPGELPSRDDSDGLGSEQPRLHALPCFA